MRGRAPGEIVDLLRRGLAAGSRAAEVIQSRRGEAEAIAAATDGTGPGDLVVLQADDSPEVTLGLVRELLANHQPAGDSWPGALRPESVQRTASIPGDLR